MMTARCARLIALCLMVLVSAPLAAQTTAPGASPPAITAPRAAAPSPTAAPVRTPAAEVEALNTEMSAIDTQIQRPNLSDGELQRLRTRIEPVLTGVRAIITRETPRLDDLNARIERIGPKPADGAAAESAEVSRNREELDRFKKEIDDTIRVARLVQVRAEQGLTTLSDMRRDLFRRAILERSDSIASPWLWQNVIHAVPQAMDEFTAFVGFRFRQGLKGFEPTQLAAALSLILATLIGYMPARRLLLRFLSRSTEEEASVVPSRGRKALAALIDIVVLTLLPFAVSLILVTAVGILGFSNDRLGELFRSLVFMLPAVTFAHGLLTRIVAPESSAWRIAPFADETAARLQQGVWAVILIVLGGKIIEACNQTISAGLPLSIAAKGLTGVLGGIAILLTLRLIRLQQEEREDSLDEFGPAVGAIGSGGVAARVVGWIVGLSAIAAPLAGYVVLGSFIIDLSLWAIAVGGVLWLLLIVVDEYLTKGLSEQSPIAARIRAMTGIAPSAIHQFGILSSGAIRLILYSLAALLTLAPLGLDPSDIFGSMRSAFFGFQIGGVTIAPSSIVSALIVFFLTLFVFRAIRTWVEETYLPSTSLDVGLQNSIATVIGYIGFILAAVFAMTMVGLSFDRIAIVAGALSVGIGFGLQSIVNNFVSGLILLWERPIRVGDLIVVGAEQGRVKRINVRATEIETVDRASLIVPNSEFISGRVQNRTHSDRMGRIVIPVGVSYKSDPETVRKVLLDVALSNQEVASVPGPAVLFKTFAESSLDFELIAFVDIDSVGAVRSDLMFAIHKRFTEEGIEFPFPTRTLDISGTETLGRAIAGHLSADAKETKA